MLCALAAIIVGAYFLYDTLGDKVDGAQLGDLSDGAGNNVSDDSTSDDNSSDEDTSDSSENEYPNASLHKAYDFTFYDENGEEVKLSDFYGKPIVLNFWASWCGPCQSEMPDFNEVYSEYKDKVHFLMLSVDESFEDAKSFVASNGLSLPIYHDKTYAGSAAYGANAIPLTYFINKDGYMVVYANFALEKSLLLEGINMIYTP